MGTFLAGAAFDLFGSYEEVFSIFAGFVIASMGIIYLVRLPERKPVAAAGSA
jgi:lipoprotein signal peptidase